MRPRPNIGPTSVVSSVWKSARQWGTRGSAFGLTMGLIVLMGCRTASTKNSVQIEGADLKPNGRTARAEQAMRAELPPNENARLQMALANQQLTHGYEEDARVRYEQARQLDPNVKGASHRLAVIHDRRGEHVQAQAAYQEALAKNPKDVDILNDLGYSYYCQGNWAKAEECYRRSLTLKKTPRSWNNLGLVLGQRGLYRESLEAFKNATDSEAKANANLGFVFLTQGKLSNAKAAYQKALRIDPSYEFARQTLAQIDAWPQPSTASKTPSGSRKPVDGKVVPTSLPASGATLAPSLERR
jgi:Tfp pilus assembly protein PilF